MSNQIPDIQPIGDEALNRIAEDLEHEWDAGNFLALMPVGHGRALIARLRAAEAEAAALVHDNAALMHSVTAETEARVAAEARQQWRPISDAPRDGTELILLTLDGAALRARWDTTAEGDDGRSIYTWHATVEGAHPRCWTDGVCWAENENNEASDPPVYWQMPPPPEGAA